MAPNPFVLASVPCVVWVSQLSVEAARAHVWRLLEAESRAPVLEHSDPPKGTSDQVGN